MNWIQRCAELYDIYQEQITNADDVTIKPLVPLYHQSYKLGLQVSINKDGEFLSAKQLVKRKDENGIVHDDRITICPVTAESAARTVNLVSMPLFDKLEYLGKDYSAFYAGSNPQKHIEYMQGMKSWIDAGKSLPAVVSIYNYLSKGTICHDIITYLASTKDADAMAKLIDSIKNTMVRFEVYGIEGYRQEIWCDTRLYNAWIDYYSSMQTEQSHDIDYVTGATDIIATTHSKGILPGDSNAKLISGNDFDGFTYRGRFNTYAEALQIGDVTSQKAHRMLKYLVENQGINIGGHRYYLVFKTDTAEPADDILGITFNRSSAITDQFQFITDFKSSLFAGVDKGSEAYNRLMEKSVVFMELEAATPGRVSVLRYEEVTYKALLQSLTDWSERCCYYVHHIENKTLRRKVPYLVDIANYAFGKKSGTEMIMDAKLRQKVVSELITCVLHSRRIPDYIYKALVNRAKSIQSFSRKEYKHLLGLIFAVHNQRESVDDVADIFTTHYINHDRDYSLARVLSIYEGIEQKACDYDDKHQTHANGMFTQFTNTPGKVLITLDRTTVPYQNTLLKDNDTYWRYRLACEYSFHMSDYGNKPVGDMFFIGLYVENLLSGKERRKAVEETFGIQIMPPEITRAGENTDISHEARCWKAYREMEKLASNTDKELTNADRYKQAFIMNPEKAMKSLHQQIKPYLNLAGKLIRQLEEKIQCTEEQEAIAEYKKQIARIRYYTNMINTRQDICHTQITEKILKEMY